MDSYLYRKFPQHAAAIQALKAQDVGFREACADYEAICTWLAEQCVSAATNTEEYAHAQELTRDLEGEIRKLLEEHNDRDKQSVRSDS